METGGRSGGAMVLGKLSEPGRPNNLDYGRARAYCVYSSCKLGLFGHFLLSSIISLFFLPVSGKQPTNNPTLNSNPSLHMHRPRRPLCPNI